MMLDKIIQNIYFNTWDDFEDETEEEFTYGPPYEAS